MKRLYCLIVLFYLASLQFAGAQTSPNIVTIAGKGGVSGYSGDGGPATAATFLQPDGLAIETAGDIYISDRNSTIRKINAAGIISTYAGTGVSGYSGDGGQATAAKLVSPQSMALDGKGNLYFIDGPWNYLRKIAPSGIITTLAGDGKMIPSGDGGPASAAGLGYAQGIAIDKAGNIYVSAENQVRKIDLSGIITSFAGTGVKGFSGDGGPASAAQISGAPRIEFDRDGNMYISDLNNYRIRKVDVHGTITTIAGKGTQGFSGDGGPALNAEFNNAVGVTVDACGNIFIADFTNNRVRMINSEMIYTIAGDGYGGGLHTGAFAGEGGPATAARLFYPETVKTDKYNNLYIVDHGNHCIRYMKMNLCNLAPALAVGDGPADNENVGIFPNPAQEEIIVAHAAGMSLSVYDMLGQKVFSASCISDRTTIDIKHFAPGNYVVLTRGSNGTVQHSRFVKNR